jgi:hypothetical protein
MARPRRPVSVLLPVLTVLALTVASAAGSASLTVRTETVSLEFHYANLPAKAGGEIVFSKGVQAIATQTALSSSPGTIKSFIAHQRGFTIVAADNAPLDAQIRLAPEVAPGATALTGRAKVPDGSTLTVRVANGTPEAIAEGAFTIPLGALGGRPPTGTPSPPPLSAAELAALQHVMATSLKQPPTPMETRITAGSSTVAGQSPTIEVRVGDTTYKQSWNPAQAGSSCPAALWLLPLDRSTLDVRGSANGVVAPICGAGAPQLTAAVDGLGKPGAAAPLVVVNSLLAGPGATAYPDVVKPLETLGFTNDLAGVDWSATAFTGIGIPGTPAGQAWSVGGAVGDDGGGAHTTGISLGGTLLINAGGNYGFNSLAVEQANLASDGGITVAGRAYPNPRPGVSGLHLVVVDRSNPAAGPMKDRVGNVYDRVYTDFNLLGQTLQSLVPVTNAMVLLASSGSPFASVGPSAKAVLAKGVADLGGTPDEIFALTGDQHYSLVAVGRSPAFDGVVQPPAITSSPVRSGQDGTLTVELTLGNRGKWWTPDAATGGSDSSDSPFAFRQIVAGPSTDWPVTAGDGSTDANRAFLWWQAQLCSCTDLRGQYVSGQAVGWNFNRTYPANADFSETAWKDVGDELQGEYGDYQHVQVFAGHVLSLFDSTGADSGLNLTAAWQNVSAELKQDENIDLASKAKSGLPLKIANAVFSFAELVPEVGEGFKAAAAILDTVAEFADTPDGRDYALDTTVGNLANAVAAQHAAQLTMLGNLLNLVFTDYGRLHAVAQDARSNDGPWYWDNTVPGRYLAATDKAAQANFYRALLPKLFEEVSTFNGLSNKITDWATLPDSEGTTAHNFSRYTSSDQWVAMPSLTDSTRWNLSAIGRTPLATHNGIGNNPRMDRPIPLSTGLIDALVAKGIYVPDMYRQWPFRTTVIDADAHYDSVTRPPGVPALCWTEPMNCYYYGPKTVLNGP